jgi:NAD-dependent dihydropyrimidine dehydrogenase PreA subunit
MRNFRYLDNTAILRLTPENCIGCGSCVEVCPHRVFEMGEKIVEIRDANGCMECGACALNCPADALYVNPDDGCGCAAYIINSWMSKFLRRDVSNCDC